MRVWIYNEKKYGTLGDERWEVEWVILTAAARRRLEADRTNYEHEHDVDEVARCSHHKTKDEALAAAQKIVDSGVTVYGCAVVTLERLEWFVKEDNVAAWEPASEPIEVTATETETK